MTARQDPVTTWGMVWRMLFLHRGPRLLSELQSLEIGVQASRGGKEKPDSACVVGQTGFQMSHSCSGATTLAGRSGVLGCSARALPWALLPVCPPSLGTQCRPFPLDSQPLPSKLGLQRGCFTERNKARQFARVAVAVPLTRWFETTIRTILRSGSWKCEVKVLARADPPEACGENLL